MTCTYCGTRNTDSDNRCRRCGRRISDTPAEFVHPTNGALAAMPQAAVVESLPSIPPSEQFPQGRLFADGTRLGRPKVIPFETFASGRVAAVAQPKTEQRPRATATRPRTPRPPDTQSKLDFLPSASTAPRKLGTTVDAVIYCDAPVASLLHRAVAAALDWSIVLIGYGLFLGAYHFAGGVFALTKQTLPVFAGAYLLLAAFYGILFALAGKETAGMHWAGLRLTNFDGFPPETGQRWMRLAGTCLSICTGGAGLLWALADEENLTWQDHMSRTFPTPLETGSCPIVRLR